jgi:dihydrofolate synthase/folylpolyglutamate synthase
MHPPSSETILDGLHRLFPKLIDLSLGRIQDLLAKLGSPQNALKNVVHIAGTNGKGSTTAMIDSLLRARGHRVHRYTSPHLVCFHERIHLNGQEISDAALTALLQQVVTANADAPITFFEVTTAAALLGFAQQDHDAVVLETGLGGRFDATNVVTSPAVTVITPIDLDHQEYLGDNLAAIAMEKAGILRPQTPLVLASQPPEVESVILAQAKALNAQVLMQNRDWRIEWLPNRRGMRYQSMNEAWIELPPPALAGLHQLQNAGVAITASLIVAQNLASHIINPPEHQQSLARGLTTVDWPARLQHLTHGAAVDQLPAGWELWLDGAHNPHGARALAAQLADWRQQNPDQPIYLALGMLARKQPADILATLLPHSDALIALPIPNFADQQYPPADLLAAALNSGYPHPCCQAANLADGVRWLATQSPAPAKIVVAGSLYLAGAVLKNP